MKRTIKWGIVGCGNVVQEKSGPAFNNVPNSLVYAVMRRDIELARIAAEKLGAKKWFDNYRDLINDPNVDAVYIATPPGSHLEIALECAKANKPAYIEKPFARNLTESKEIVEVFKVTNTPLFIAHYRRALDKFIELKKAIESGEIGKVTKIESRLARKYYDIGVNGTPGWLYRPEISGGGKFFDIAPHTIDLLIFLFGNLEITESKVSRNNQKILVEDWVSLSYRFGNEISGSAVFDLNANEKVDQMTITGDKGLITFNIHGNSPIIIKGKQGQREINIKNPEFIEEPMIKTVVEELLGSGKCPCSGEEALDTVRVIDQILSDFYNGRDDNFWERPESWNN